MIYSAKCDKREVIMWILVIVICSRFSVSFAGGNSSSGFLRVNEKSYTIGGESKSDTHSLSESMSVNFNCQKTEGRSVILMYQKQDGENILTPLQKSDSVQLFMKGTAAVHNNTTMTCSVISTDGSYKNSITLNFVIDYHPETEKGYMSFKVNNLILNYYQQEGIRTLWKYKYYSAEQLTIDIIKDDSTYRKESCRRDGNSAFLKSTQLISTNFIFPFSINLDRDASGGNISCMVTNSSEIVITLEHQDPDYKPFISGLLRRNILLMYTDASNNIIQYNYDNSLQQFRCLDGEDGNSWKYEAHDVCAETLVNGWILCRLRENVTSSTLECPDATQKKTHLQLIRTKSKTKTAINQNVFTTMTPKQGPHSLNTNKNDVADTSTCIMPEQGAPPQLTNSNDVTPTSPRISNAMMVVVIVLPIIIIIAALCALVVAIKKLKLKARQRNPADINYQNLPQHNEGPMAMPAQWESQYDYAYAVPHIFPNRNLYSTSPVPKSQREVKLQTEYAEPTDSKDCEPFYASVYESTISKVAKNKPVYAEVGATSPYQNLGQLDGPENKTDSVEITSYNTETTSSASNLNDIQINQPEQNYANTQELKQD